MALSGLSGLAGDFDFAIQGKILCVNGLIMSVLEI